MSKLILCLCALYSVSSFAARNVSSSLDKMGESGLAFYACNVQYALPDSPLNKGTYDKTLQVVAADGLDAEKIFLNKLSVEKSSAGEMVSSGVASSLASGVARIIDYSCVRIER